MLSNVSRESGLIKRLSGIELEDVVSNARMLTKMTAPGTGDVYLRCVLDDHVRLYRKHFEMSDITAEISKGTGQVLFTLGKYSIILTAGVQIGKAMDYLVF